MTTTSKRVLIVEDDPEIAELMQLHLRDDGFFVALAADGDTGIRLLRDKSWDVLVLDIMLPGVNGLEICRQARTMDRYTPMIITSARGSEIERVLGLELGADDYLAKPFSLAEFCARVKALVRRVDALSRSAAGDAGTLNLGALTISPLEREITLGGSHVDLTPLEFELLYFFARAPGRVFSRSELLDQVWGTRHSGYEHTVNTHINRLRAKIEADPGNPRYIVTVWGRGYKLASDMADRP